MKLPDNTRKLPVFDKFKLEYHTFYIFDNYNISTGVYFV